ncbi:hypothetical protein PTSG_07788 [Salpingoeca rosetta]|uniref:Endonuclease/exonuclease/phosphatase domain-containing protein n=1 Tax=Salpingoeca rosetta (strain ATCC 50818 / BSB-021) TaxID=946362 RepID=F2UGB9_SALR5|nr:uncharacterized protein PTSG_07788 [Salpingoeca rosetta]EGD75669.1 hypothetical protein PTSG_07788 [Salpingoeca rosetta]|eukprot:XP_004991590.1 hypothetical protein PTSG_07788 [Salpingoeca rosetta]
MYMYTLTLTRPAVGSTFGCIVQYSRRGVVTTAPPSTNRSSPGQAGNKQLEQFANNGPQTERPHLSATNQRHPDHQDHELRVLSWNINAPSKSRQRLPKDYDTLQGQVTTLRSDVVMLQEVVERQLADLVKVMQDAGFSRCGGVPLVYSGDSIAPSVPPHFTLTFVRKKRLQLVAHKRAPFTNSRKARDLNTCTVRCKRTGKEVWLGNVHLETYRKYAGRRCLQFLQSLQALSRHDLGILAGDMNLREAEAQRVLQQCRGAAPYTSIGDAWEMVGSPKEQEFTWDLQLNTSWSHFPNNPRIRFDRCYVKGLRARSFELVGTRALTHFGHFSDHFGICTHLQLPSDNDEEEQGEEEQEGALGIVRAPAQQQQQKSCRIKDRRPQAQGPGNPSSAAAAVGWLKLLRFAFAQPARLFWTIPPSPSPATETRPVQRDFLRLVSWNINGFTPHDELLPGRLAKMQEELSGLDADVVLLQEAERQNLQLLHTLMEEIGFVPCDAPPLATLSPKHCVPEHFTATFMRESRFELLAQERMPFQSSQRGRDLNTCILRCTATGNKVWVGNVHFESMGTASEARCEQFAESLVEMSQHEHSVLAGDTNLRDEEGDDGCSAFNKQMLPGSRSIVQDAWELSGSPRQYRFTWDTLLNDRVDTTSWGGRPRARFDRCFVKGLTASDFRLIGTHKSPDVLVGLVSDHFGICVDLHWAKGKAECE